MLYNFIKPFLCIFQTEIHLIPHHNISQNITEFVYTLCIDNIYMFECINNERM